MKAALRLFIGAIWAMLAPLSGAQAQNALVADAIAAVGGESALTQLNSMSARGQVTQREFESSYEPGAKAEARIGSESKFVLSRDFTNDKTRIDWERRVLRAAKPFDQKFSEILSGGIGYVSGVDSGNRIALSTKSNPPGHPMSGARAAATLREIARQSPRLLLDMKNNPGSLAASGAQTIDGKRYPAVRYTLRDWNFLVMFDPETKLPARIRTRDGDPIQGDSNFDLVLADWRAVGPLKIAHALTYQLNSRDLVSIKYDAVSANPSLSASLFEIPIAARAVAVRAAMGSSIPYQWIIRRGYWGSLIDSDTVGWDASAREEPNLVDIAPGVSVSQGSTHNSMVVEMDKYLVVFDAPIGEQFSEWMIKASKQRYPGKPIRYLVLTHHHWDHTSGARTYAAEGASVIVGKGNKEHFSKTFSAPGAALNDRLHRNPRQAQIIEVGGKHVLKDAKRTVEVLHIESQHSIATLIGHVPDARLGFVTDIWSTNAPLGAKPTAGQMDLVNGTKKWRIEPERFAHGHGSPAPFAPLLKLAAGG